MRWTFMSMVGMAAVILVAVGCTAESSPGPAADDPNDEESTPIAGWKLQPRALSKTVRVEGTVEPVERIRIKSNIAGTVDELPVEEGDRVRRGDLLAASDTSEMRAELESAQARLNKVTRQYERNEPLAETQAIRPAELEDLESDVEIAKREVELWETRIERSRLRAPKDAVVTDRHLDPGSYAAANEPLVDLADVSTLVVRVRLSERDVVHLDSGDSVDVVADAHPEQTLEGTIRRVFPTADADSRRVTVEIALDDIPDDVTVKPGFLARATVDVDRRTSLAVPGESLLASTPDDRFVYAVEDDRLVRRDVTTGVRRGNLVEITDGLEEGDVVVGTNPTNLQEDTPVHVSEWVEVR